MKHFDLNIIIKHFGLNTFDLGRLLFPNVQYPKQAINRVLKGETDLSTTQVEALAEHLNITVAELYNADNEWKGSTEDGCLVLINKEYKAKLRYNGVLLTLYKNNKIVEEVISGIPDMSMKQFISYLNNLIKNY